MLYEGELHLSKLLQPQNDLKYIIVIPNINLAPSVKLPKAPCLFATVKYTGGDAPAVTFYSEEDINA